MPDPMTETRLDPLEEILFRHWLKAIGLLRRRRQPDDIKPPLDYRRIYQQTGGVLVPRPVAEMVVRDLGQWLTPNPPSKTV